MMMPRKIGAILDKLSDDERETLHQWLEQTCLDVIFSQHNRFMAKDAKHLLALNRKDEHFTVLAMMFADEAAEERGYLDS